MTTIHDVIELHAHLPGHVLAIDKAVYGGNLVEAFPEAFLRDCKVILRVDRVTCTAEVYKTSLPIVHEHENGVAIVRIG